jgi:hypothetical protein
MWFKIFLWVKGIDSMQAPHRLGILLHKGWTKALIVLIPLKEHMWDYIEDDAITVAC